MRRKTEAKPELLFTVYEQEYFDSDYTWKSLVSGNDTAERQLANEIMRLRENEHCLHDWVIFSVSGDIVSRKGNSS